MGSIIEMCDTPLEISFVPNNRNYQAGAFGPSVVREYLFKKGESSVRKGKERI